MIIRKKPPARAQALTSRIRHEDTSAAGARGAISWARLSHRRGLLIGASALVQRCLPIRAPAHATLAPDIDALQARLRHHHHWRRQDSLHLLRPGRRRESERFGSADRRQGRAAGFPLHRRLRQAWPAGQHDAQLAQLGARRNFIDTASGSPGTPTAAICAAFKSKRHRTATAAEHQRRRHCRACRENDTGEQSAQSHVRHL